jgi:methylated-DNA-[protein]-cysteine S-methyltransferase
VRLTLPQASEKEALAEIGPGQDTVRVSFERFDETVSRIRDYFRGKPVDFEDKLDLSAGSVFQRSVWAACRDIPYGETRSYGWIAGLIGKSGASRAVGNALGKNPVPIIIPCHRVLAAGRRNWWFQRGLKAKRRLLKLEGIKPK